MKTNSNIYVTGHTGMVGSAIMRKLTAEGYMNIITRTHAEINLTCQKDVEAFFDAERPEYVFHIAAKTGGVMLNKEYPTEYLVDNALITLNVIRAANQFGAKGLVYASSANVYPENAPQPMSECLVGSGKVPFFLEGYALAKQVGIKLCESIHRQYGKRFTAVILPAVYGTGDRGTTVMPMLVDKFANAVINREETVTVWGTGAPRREFINSRDLADAMLFIMNNYEGGEPLNVGSGYEVTIRELAEKLKDISGFSGEVVFDTTKPDSAGRQFLDSSKLCNMGWKPSVDFTEGVREVYAEHFNWAKEKS